MAGGWCRGWHGGQAERGGRVPDTLSPAAPCALLSPRESSRLRPSGVMDGGRWASLWGSALLGFTS